MMVVHEDSVTPMEVDIIRKSLLEQKSYVIVKNHVRELIKTDESTSTVMISNEKSPQPLDNVRKMKRKSVIRPNNTEQLPLTSMECEDETSIATEIDKNDLEELRTIYNKCKEVMRKIKTKYGHLLDFDAELSSCKKRKYTEEYSTDNEINECDCKLNSKIVFDDDGNQSTVETVSEKHICVKKVFKEHSEMQTRSKTIAIEYTENEIPLPDNLPELTNLLQDPNIEKAHRNKIIEKVKMLKQEYVNDIKFNKHAIIEKIKANPDEMLGFKGTNLSTIPGYS